MQRILIDHRTEIAEICRTHHVRQLSVFGSAVRDDFDFERSDVDMLVDFEKIGDFRYAKNFFALQKSLTHLLDRDVDLIVDGSIKNPYLLKSIERDAKVLYAS